MGNGQPTETAQNQENQNIGNKQVSTSSATSEAEIKEYFNTKFPVVISPEVFSLRYLFIIIINKNKNFEMID